MRALKKIVSAGLIGLALGAAGAAQAGFSFGDDDDHWWGPPGWGNPYWGAPYAAPGWGSPAYGPRGAPPPWYLPPRLGSYDRSIMRQKRQRQMSNHGDAMEELGDMIYGRYRFEREEAIELARQIEAAAGPALIRNFHPGAIATDGSHTTPAFWGNEATFKANADALKAAAGALADELEKGLEEEGAGTTDGARGWRYEKPVSPEVRNRFKQVANTCRACHATFRGPEW
ncbi:MAG: cytochrome c [Chromatiales bacterium]